MSQTIRVTVSDAVADRLQKDADVSRRDLEFCAARRLSRATELLPRDERAVVLSGEDLDTLETILGGGSLLSGSDLRKKVERLAGISFHHIRLPFSPNMLEALADKAERQGLTPNELIERTAPRVYEQFFDLMQRSI